MQCGTLAQGLAARFFSFLPGLTFFSGVGWPVVFPSWACAPPPYHPSNSRSLLRRPRLDPGSGSELGVSWHVFVAAFETLLGGSQFERSSLPTLTSLPLPFPPFPPPAGAGHHRPPHQAARHRRQQDQDARPRRAVGAPRAGPLWPQDRPHRGRDPDPDGHHPPEGRSPRSPPVECRTVRQQLRQLGARARAPPRGGARPPPSRRARGPSLLCVGGARAGAIYFTHFENNEAHPDQLVST